MTESIHFVTGKLAAPALTDQVQRAAASVAFEYSIDVLPITVAALMTPAWIAKHISIPEQTTRILIPGYCDGDLSPLRALTDVPITPGPKDLRALGDFLGAPELAKNDYGKHTIEILAEINHAPRRSMHDILNIADAMRRDGADVIDLGCDPDARWEQVGQCVTELRQSGHRVSIDSFDPEEVADATACGAELVLSVNQQNREQAVDWGVEVVVVPDDPGAMDSFHDTVQFLAKHDVPFRLDPILEPIGFGFARSLGRYLEIRKRYPEAPMMMGIGNLTELTDCDSAALNAMLIGFCQETGIHSVLTTEVIPWARSSIRECAAARELMHYAITNRSLPKRTDTRLIMLRDDRVYAHGDRTLEELARRITDHSIRIFAEAGKIHAMTRGFHAWNSDPFELMQSLQEHCGQRLDASHAFYLGFEMAKAATALTLGKQYTQDEALDWGLLTQPEHHERSRRTSHPRPEK